MYGLSFRYIVREARRWEKIGVKINRKEREKNYIEKIDCDEDTVLCSLEIRDPNEHVGTSWFTATANGFV